MIIYYAGLGLIFLLFSIILIFLLKSKISNNIYKISYLISVLFLSIGLIGGGYYFYGALQPLRSLYAYREIHDLLETLQKTNTTTAESIDHALASLYLNLPQTEYVHAKMGEVYLALNLPYKAQRAYQQALKIKVENRDYLYGFYYAESLNNHGKLSEQSIQALYKLIDVFPKDNGFFNLLAVHCFQTADYGLAIQYWEKIQSDNSDEANLIQSMVSRATLMLGKETENSPKIELTIKWNDPNIQQYAALFISVKKPNEPMPVLVKKLRVPEDIQAGHLQSFTLSNLDVMNPERKLQKGQKWIIAVKGSMSGLADKSSEDKIVESKAILLDSNRLETEIIF